MKKPLRPLPIETERLLREGDYNTEASGVGVVFWSLVEDKIDEWLDKYDHHDLRNVLDNSLNLELSRLVVLRRRERELQKK